MCDKLDMLSYVYFDNQIIAHIVCTQCHKPRLNEAFNPDPNPD